MVAVSFSPTLTLRKNSGISQRLLFYFVNDYQLFFFLFLCLFVSKHFSQISSLFFLLFFFLLFFLLFFSFAFEEDCFYVQ